MTLASFFVLCCMRAAFEAHSFELTANNAGCFIAPLTPEENGLFVLSETRMTVYRNAVPERSFEIVFEPGLSAVDVGDLDGDTQAELVAIQGKSILATELVAPNASSNEPVNRGMRELFQRDTLYAGACATPFLTRLLVTFEGKTLLALPCEETLDLLTLQGEVAQSYPIGPQAPRRVVLGRPFQVQFVDPPRIGGPGALELLVSRLSASDPELPDIFTHSERVLPPERRITFGQLYDAGRRDPSLWPRLPLGPKEADIRAGIAVAGSALSTVTSVRIVSRAQQGGDSFGPQRDYPGTPLLPLPWEDFNGDGYQDLALWQAKELSPSLGALTRGALVGRWPYYIVLHLYEPSAHRFDAQAAGTIVLDASIEQWLDTGGAAPLRNMLVRDFDGDGKLELGGASEPGKYCLWRFDPEHGFSDAPIFEQTCAAPIDTVAFIGPAAPGKGFLFGLRAGDVLWVVRPAEK